MTDYLRLAQERAPAANEEQDNPYLPLAREQQTLQQNRARTVIETALKDDPELAAERLRLSQTSGLPPDVVQRNLEELRVKERARAIDLADLASESPVLYRQIVDPTFATTSIDDLDTLKNIERSIGKGVRYVMGADGKGGLPTDAGGAAVDLGLAATAGVGEMIFNLAGTVNDLIGWQSGAAGARAQANASREARNSFGLQAETSTGQAVKSGLQSAGTNLAILPLGLSRTLFATANQAAATVAGIMATGVGADAYLTAREKGKGQGGALAYAIPQAAFEYVFEQIPASKLFGDIAMNTGLLKTLGKQTVSEGWTEQVTTLAQDFNEWMNLNPDKTLGQFIQERPEAAYQTFIATLVGVGVQTTTIQGINKVVEQATNKSLVFEQDQLQQQMLLASQSLLRQRSPEQFRAHVQQVVEANDGAKKEIYVDGEVLNQLPPELLAQLPESVREAIPAALETRSTVAIPMADVLTVAPGTDLEQILNDNARMRPNAASRVEAELANQYLAQEAERVLKQAADTAAWQQSSDTVKQTLLEQLNTAGRFTPDVNEAYAALQANFFSTMAARVGVTPQELYDRYALKVAGSSQAGAGNLEQGTEQPRDLIVAHNLTAENFRAALEMGGLPAPSLAITKVDAPIEGFGEITLVGDTKLATPSAKNPVFDADVYSPRFPDVKVKVDEKAVKAALQPLMDAAKAAGLPARRPDSVIAEMGRNRIGNAISDLSYDNGMRLGYANAVLGKNLTAPTKEVAPQPVAKAGARLTEQSPLKELLPTLNVGELTPDTAGDLGQKVYAALVNKTLADLEAEGKGSPSERFERGMELVNRRIRLFAETEIEQGSKEFEPDKVGKMTSKGLYSLYNLVRSTPKTETEETAGARTEVDTEALNKLLDAEAPVDDFKAWVREQLRPAMGERRVVTESGRTTAFTLDNIVKAMTRKVRDAEGFNYGLGNARSKGATKFKNLKQIQGQRDRVVGKDAFDAARKEIDAEFSDLAKAVTPFQQYERDSAFELLAEAIGNSYSMPLAKALEDAALINVPADLQARIAEFAGTLVGAPTEYFEAKPQRAVGFNEFRGAVVPTDTPADVRELLTAQGLQLVEYRKGDEQSRAQAARQLAEALNAERGDVLFQQARGTFNPQSLLITLNENANLSTFLHESGHFFLEVMADLASQPDAPAQVREDMDKLLAWFGIKGDETVGGADSGVPLAQGGDVAALLAEAKAITARMRARSAADRAAGLEQISDESLAANKADGLRVSELMAQVEAARRKPVEVKTTNPTASAAYQEAAGAQRQTLDRFAEWAPGTSGFALRKAGESLNTSASASFTDYEILPGVQRVELSELGDLGGYNDSKEQKRIKKLVDDLKRSGEIEPIFVGVDANGEAWIMEGQHRARAFRAMGYRAIPARVVVDLSEGRQTLAQDGNLPVDNTQPAGRTPLETWRAMTLDQKRQYHERWAESFEEYLFSGKAPNVELQSLFRRFRAFLVNAYKSLVSSIKNATGDDVAKAFSASTSGKSSIKFNDEIRQVFDRLIATDEQIAQAEEAAGLLPDFDATNEAIEQLQARSLRDLKWTVNARNKAIKALQKQAAELRKGVEEEVRAEVERQPLYAAMKWLRKGEMVNAAGEEIKAEKGFRLNTEALAEMYPESMLSRPDLAKLKGMTAKGGLHPDLVADMFGFESGDALVRNIIDAEPIASVVEGMTDQRMLERHGDLATPEAIADAANEAVHNAARARSLATELKSQAEMMNQRQDTGRQASNGRTITVNAIEQAAKEFAKNIAARRRIKDLRNAAWQHRSAEARAGKRWQQATAAGNTQDAVQAKRDQLLNNLTVKALQEAQAEAKKILEWFGKVTKGNDEKVVKGGRDPDVVNAMRAILAAYDVAPRLEKSALEYMELVAKNDPAMYAALKPGLDAALFNAKPLAEMTVEELRGLNDELRAMWTLAKRSRQMEVDGNLLDIEDAADQLLDRMGEVGIPDEIPGERGAITDRQELGIKVQFAKAILSRVEQWAERLDGKFGGPFLRLVFQPVKEAADRYRTERVAYRQRFTALLQNVAPVLRPGAIAAPELGYTFGNARDSGQAELLHALLHTGNESNKRKLLLGRRWASENADGTLDTSRWDAFIQRMIDEGKLEKAHYDFAQGVWDLLEEMKPLAQETHRKVFGRYFAEVTANEFTTPFGTYRGGYAPAQTDPRLVKDAKLRELAEGENESMAYAFPAAPSGFTKARVEYNQPLLLDLRALAQHMDKVLLFSHMQGTVTDVRRLLTNKRVSYALDRVDPGAYEGMLIPWLNRAARQVVETPVVGDRKLSRFLSAARSRAGMALMFANLSNTVQQITGFSTAAVKVKPGLLLQAAGRFIANPKEMKTTVAEASAFMRDRMLNEVSAMNDAIEQILIDPTLLERGQAWTQRHAYFMQAAVDNTMSPIIWTAAYNQAMEQGQSERDAIRFADGVVRQTQGTTLPEDISRFESGPGYARLFTQFVSYFNMLANTNATAMKQIVDEVGMKRGAGKLLYVAVAGMLAPIWVAEAIAQAFRGGPEDDEGDGWLDDWLMAVFGLGTIRGLTAQIPIVGQAAQLVVNRFNDNPADDKFSLSPAVSLIESTVSAPSSVYKAIVDDGNKQKAVRDVAAAATMITGLPIYGIARPIGYLTGVADERVEPTSPVDFARGVATGTASAESRVP